MGFCGINKQSMLYHLNVTCCVGCQSLLMAAETCEKPPPCFSSFQPRLAILVSMSVAWGFVTGADNQHVPGAAWDRSTVFALWRGLACYSTIFEEGSETGLPESVVLCVGGIMHQTSSMFRKSSQASYALVGSTVLVQSLNLQPYGTLVNGTTVSQEVAVVT